jgi:hypothetical protein
MREKKIQTVTPLPLKHSRVMSKLMQVLSLCRFSKLSIF